MKNKEEKLKYPIGIWFVFWSLFGFLFFEGSIFSLFFLGMFFLVKPYFEDWARQIKKNPITPFCLVMLFGLIGYFGYWIYYKTKLKGGVKEDDI